MKTFRLLFALLLLAAFTPKAFPWDVTVDNNQVVSLDVVVTAGDVVICKYGVKCDATTPAEEIAGVGVFYLSFTGPYTPDVGPANTVTLLSGSQLTNFLTNYPGGFSPNAIFVNVGPNGLVKVGVLTFNTAT